jgi:hypothetical protein
MYEEILSTTEAARRLGISRASLYDWLSQSNAGQFVLRGQPVRIDYFQGGASGQGRIMIEAREIERLKEMMRVRPRSTPQRQPPVRQAQFPGISVKLGRPEP